MYPYHVLVLRFFPYIAAGIIFEIAWYLLLWKAAYPWKEMAASVGVYALRLPARFLTAVLIGGLALFVWSLRPLTIPLDTVWGVILLFLGVEFAYYWMHRCDHTIRWMWATHVVHHTPEHLHFASAFRLGATDLVSGGWLFFMPLYLIGFNPVAVAGMLAVNLFYQFWLHTDVIGKLGLLEWIFNTPSHHRVHHASNSEYLDRNYGGILIVWDRMFGTFAEEQPQIAINYGLVQPIGSLNPLKLAFHEWIAMGKDFYHAPTWSEKRQQLFGRPGGSLASLASSPDESVVVRDQILLTGTR
jgi:sterol desaturase/sphingolipid hydroxylase (fatty acid hydroxylase superfamily)